MLGRRFCLSGAYQKGWRYFGLQGVPTAMH